MARKPRDKQRRPMQACCTRTAGSVQAVPGLERLQGGPGQVMSMRGVRRRGDVGLLSP
jgi:hypothetical protein